MFRCGLRGIPDGPHGAASDTESMVKSGLQLRDLRRSFGEQVAVNDLSFSIPAATVFGFVGRNGAGKTTTMRIICGLLAADAGSVLWDGRPIDARARERIGYMPEERGLYPKMRVGDQLEYFAVLHGASHEQGRAAARTWLERLGLGERVSGRVEELPTATSSGFNSRRRPGRTHPAGTPRGLRRDRTAVHRGREHRQATTLQRSGPCPANRGGCASDRRRGNRLR